MKSILLLFSLIIRISLNAQYTFVDSTYRTFNYSTIENHKFPYLYNPKNKKVVDKINKELYDTLYKDVLAVDTNDLNNGHWAFDVTNRQIYNQNKKVVSFWLSTWSCGMTCYGFGYHFNYESKTGNKIELDSLFTVEGIRVLGYSLQLYKHELIDKHIEELEKNDEINLKQFIDFGDTPITILQSIIMDFNNCKELRDNYIKFQITGDQIEFDLGNCLPRSYLIYDLGINVPINIKDWEKYLTPYGKRLLL